MAFDSMGDLLFFCEQTVILPAVGNEFLDLRKPLGLCVCVCTCARMWPSLVLV